MKIENGYRLRIQPLATVPRVHALIESFKARARPILQDQLYRQAADLAAQVLDRHALQLPNELAGVPYLDEIESPLAVAYRILLDRHQLDYEDGEDFAFDAGIMLFIADGDVLAMLQTSCDAVKAAWEATEGVEPFAYWDDPGPPENVSLEEWAIRQGIWEHALDSDHPSALGYSTTCFGRYGLPVPTAEDLIVRLPSRDERAALYATNRAVQHYVRRQAPQSRKAKALALITGLQWTREERDGHAMVEIERETIADILPEITAELLTA